MSNSPANDEIKPTGYFRWSGSLIVFLAVVAGCTRRPPVQLTTTESPDPLGVATMADDVIASTKESHSEKSSYRKAYSSPETYEAWSNDKNGGGAYGDLNYKLHDSIRGILRAHFRDVPFPAGYDSSRGDAAAPESRYLAFAYHNWDWFDPDCQVRVEIATDQINRDLLAKLQSLLVNEFADWCIILIASTDREFDNEHELLVFATSVKVPASFMAKYAK